MAPHKFALVESGGKGNACCGCCYCTKAQRRCTLCLIGTPLALLTGLIVALLIKAAIIQSPFVLQKLDPAPTFMNLSQEDALVMAGRLGRAIQIRTISYNETVLNTTALTLIHDYLKTTYPSVFEAEFVTVDVVNKYSLLLRIEGTVPTKNPYLLCAHLDVVPEGNGVWSRNPFSGEIYNDDVEGSTIFGRGAIDDKQAVIGILESLNYLIEQGHQPNRTFYVAFGHDEEVSGNHGAAKVAKLLKKKLTDNDELLDFILDEGMFVMDRVFPGVTDPIVYVGVVEKGWANVKLSVSGVQGHSSTPPKESAIGILAHAISKLEDERQPSKFGDGVEYDTMDYVAPFASFGYRVVLGNLWLFNSAVSKILASDSATDAIQRTTTAVTVVEAGVKTNVIPSEAIAYINHRIHPADNAENVAQIDREIIDDGRVNVDLMDNFAPTKVSPYHSQSVPFQIIVNSAFEVFPDAHVTPGTMVANTDTKHYQDLCQNIYRFQPILLGKSDLSRFHGVDERISVKSFVQVVEFYRRIMINSDYDTKEKQANNDDFFEVLILEDESDQGENNSTLLEEEALPEGDDGDIETAAELREADL